MSAQSGPSSGGDLFHMAKDGSTVPENAAKPRIIKSVPRPDEVASSSDPNYIGGTNFAEAATNAGDIPRTSRDTAGAEILTGTGDALPSQVDSKRLHQVPGGVTHDDQAKGSTRYTEHKRRGQSEFVTGQSDGAEIEKAPGDEGLTDEQAKDKLERKV